MPQGVGGLVYLSDSQENVSRVSPAGRAYFSDSYERIKLHSPINVASSSGGSQLESAPVGKVYLRSESGNAIMWWGGTGDDAPYSGHGFPLWGGETSPIIPVTNFSSVRVCSSVSGQVVYPIGFLNGQDVTMTNAVPSYPDITVPYIVSNSPVSGLSGVALNADISVRFSEAISPGTTVSGALRLSPAHDVTIFRDTSNPTDVVIRPNVNLSGSTVYFATLVSGAITDLAGNIATSGRGWPFTTTNAPPPPDVTAPTISGITPVSGGVLATLSDNQTVLFSEQMLSGTINSTNIYLASTSGAATGDVTSTISLDAGDRKTVTINPAGDLTNGQTYYINVKTGVQDLAGNPLAAATTNHKFSTSYNFTEVYNVNTTASGNLTGAGTDLGTGVKVVGSCDLKDKIPKKVVAKLKRDTGATGTVSITIRNAANAIVTTFATFSATTLTTTYADYTFTNLANTTALALDYSLVVEYSGPDTISVARSTSNLYIGTLSLEIDSAGLQNERDTLDTSMLIYS